MKKLLLLPLCILLSIGGLRGYDGDYSALTEDDKVKIMNNESLNGHNNSLEHYTYWLKDTTYWHPNDKNGYPEYVAWVVKYKAAEKEAARKAARTPAQIETERRAALTPEQRLLDLDIQIEAAALKKLTDKEEALKRKPKLKIIGKTGCKAGTMLVTQCGQDIEIECNSDTDFSALKVVCDTGKNAFESGIQIKDIIPSSNFKNLGKIEKEQTITSDFTMPKMNKMSGFTYIPTKGKYANKKIWYIIRDDSSAGAPIVKIYRTSGKSVTNKTLWEEMGAITNETMTYNELVSTFNDSKANNKGILISPDGTITLDFMAKDPQNNRRIVFTLDPIK